VHAAAPDAPGAPPTLRPRRAMHIVVLFPPAARVVRHRKYFGALGGALSQSSSWRSPSKAL
jgi:hypothetical protein